MKSEIVYPLSENEKRGVRYFSLLVGTIWVGFVGLFLASVVSSVGCGAEDLIRDLIVTRLVAPENGASGTDGIDGAPGVDGEDGQDGIDGAAGIDGTDGIDGSDGTNGQDGQNGLDGNTDGFSELLESCWVECPPNFNEPCEIVCPETGESATRLTPADAVPKP